MPNCRIHWQGLTLNLEFTPFVLSPAELRRAGEVLREVGQEGIELPSSIAAIRLLMFTGCRLGRNYDAAMGPR